MRRWKRKRSFLRTAGALALLALLLVACAKVEVVDTTPVPSTPGALSSPLPAGGATHDLAIMAVDFDPPLDYHRPVLPRKSVTLLVAVENIGRSTERDVIVQAQLTSSEDPQFLLAQQASLATIAPGEIQVVRFPPLDNVPRHGSYHLEVKVNPAVGEGKLDDNSKAFDIKIKPETQNQAVPSP